MLRHDDISLAKSDPWDKSEGLCNSYITGTNPKSALGSQCPQMFPILCFVSQNRFIPLTTGQSSKEKFRDLLKYFSFFLAEGLQSLLSLLFFHTTWYPVFTALDISFCKVLHKCIQMMGNLGVFEPLVRDEQGLVIQRLEGLCPWLFLCEAVVQSECKINLLGTLDPATLMKLI